MIPVLTKQMSQQSVVELPNFHADSDVVVIHLDKVVDTVGPIFFVVAPIFVDVSVVALAFVLVVLSFP